MEVESQISEKVDSFFQEIFGEVKKGKKKVYSLKIRIKFYRIENENSKEFTILEAEKFINRAVEKNLGKIGLARFRWNVERINPYECSIELSIEEINAEDFCVFWSTVTFIDKIRL